MVEMGGRRGADVCSQVSHREAHSGKAKEAGTVIETRRGETRILHCSMNDWVGRMNRHGAKSAKPKSFTRERPAGYPL